MSSKSVPLTTLDEVYGVKEENNSHVESLCNLSASFASLKILSVIFRDTSDCRLSKQNVSLLDETGAPSMSHQVMET